MAETSQFELPLLASAQAQKHVTVNEALAVLDCVAQLRLLSATIATPPTDVVDGDAYMLPLGADGAWAGMDGKLAIAVNGGWRFLTPKAGWQSFNTETGTHQLYDGTDWLDSTLAATPSGTATEFQIVELDHQITAGSSNVTAPIIPAQSVVTGVTARVSETITGTLSSWQMGVPGGLDRYGTGFGLPLNSFALGLTGSPLAYYSDTGIELTADGGDFSGGTIRIAVHYMRLVPPRPI